MEYTERPLTEEECTKLKKERKLGYAVGMVAGAVVAAIIGLLFALEVTSNMSLLVLLLAIPVGFVASLLVNRNLNDDIRYGRKHVYVKEIDEISHSLESKYLHNSLCLPCQGTYRMEGYYLTSGNLKYPITEAERKELEGQTQCELHYAPRSFTLLGVHSIKK